MRSRGDRGGDASQTNFSDTASAQWVNFFVGIIEKMHFELGNVGVHRHDIVGDVTVDWRAVLWVISCVLEQRHPDSHHHSAFDLVAPGQRVNNAPRDRKSTRLNSSHLVISYAVFC